MTKRNIRENLYKLLFQTDFHDRDSWEEQADLYLENLEGKEATAGAKEKIKVRYMNVLSHLEEIDERIAKKSEGWSFSRLAKADLTIMRLAIFEMIYDDAVPNGVAINEAVELAKKFGTDKSYRFVNGILASVNKEID